MASVYSFLQTYLIIKGASFQLTDFVQSLNQFLCTSTTSDKFVTAWFGLLDASKGKLESISAGHEPCYVYRAGNAAPESLSAGGLLLGMMNLPYLSEEITMHPGDMLLCYTDGVTEAMNPEHVEFGLPKMLEAVGKCSSDRSAHQIVESILSAVTEHRDTQIQSDDITLGVIQMQ